MFTIVCHWKWTHDDAYGIFHHSIQFHAIKLVFFPILYLAIIDITFDQSRIITRAPNFGKAKTRKERKNIRRKWCERNKSVSGTANDAVNCILDEIDLVSSLVFVTAEFDRVYRFIVSAKGDTFQRRHTAAVTTISTTKKKGFGRDQIRIHRTTQLDRNLSTKRRKKQATSTREWIWMFRKNDFADNNETMRCDCIKANWTWKLIREQIFSSSHPTKIHSATRTDTETHTKATKIREKNERNFQFNLIWMHKKRSNINKTETRRSDNSFGVFIASLWHSSENFYSERQK